MKNFIITVFLLNVFIIASMAAAQAPVKQVEFKGFVFGQTTYDDWRKAVHEVKETGLYEFSKQEVVSPYCAEDGADFLLKTYNDKSLSIKGCYRYIQSSRCWRCISSVGSAATNENIWVFLDDTLTYFTASMYHEQLNNLLSPLNAKYGSPTSVISENVSTGFGVKFTNKIYTWELGSMTIIVEKYAGTTDTSTIKIFNPKLFTEMRRRQRAKPVDTSGL